MLRHFQWLFNVIYDRTDVPVCVLICLDVFVGFQDQKLVQNKQKLEDFAPQNPENPILLHAETFPMTF